MKPTLVVKDLSLSTDLHCTETVLSPERMKRIVGGRNVVVTVDGTHTGTVDDWGLNIAIFEGRIKGTMI